LPTQLANPQLSIQSRDQKARNFKEMGIEDLKQEILASVNTCNGFVEKEQEVLQSFITALSTGQGK